MKVARLAAGGVPLLLGLLLFGKSGKETPPHRSWKRSAVASKHETSVLPVPESVASEESPGIDPIALPLDSCDAAERADAVDALPTHRPEEAPTLLEQILASDPDAHVRERAVLAYAERLGPQAVPLIRRLALNDPDENVASTARAALHSLRSEYPEPARGWMIAEVPESFVTGETVTLGLRFGSSVDVSEVTLRLRLPKGVELVSPQSTVWWEPTRLRFCPRSNSGR